jgi:hypothetical protein
MSYDKILARLEASKEKCARLKSECVLLEDAIQEYTRAWDAAGEIWNAACEAEDNGMLGKAKKLWSLLAPFDDEAATRLEELL